MREEVEGLAHVELDGREREAVGDVRPGRVRDHRLQALEALQTRGSTPQPGCGSALRRLSGVPNMVCLPHTSERSAAKKTGGVKYRVFVLVLFSLGPSKRTAAKKRACVFPVPVWPYARSMTLY